MAQIPPRRIHAGESAATNLLLIFVLAVIFTVFAMPTYRSYNLREHSKLARIVLVDASARFKDWQETHPGQRPRSFEDLGFPSSAIYVLSDGTARPSANISSIYRVSVVPADAPPGESCGLPAGDSAAGFILMADPVQTQRIETQCGRLCLASSGQKGIGGSAASPAQCWGAS